MHVCTPSYIASCSPEQARMLIALKQVSDLQNNNEELIIKAHKEVTKWNKKARGRLPYEKVRAPLVGKFELNPSRRPIRALLELYLTSKRYHLRRTRLDYQPLFRKGARAIRPDLRDWRNSRLKSLKTEIRAFLLLSFFDCTLTNTLTAKNCGVSSSTPQEIPEYLIYTP